VKASEPAYQENPVPQRERYRSACPFLEAGVLAGSSGDAAGFWRRVKADRLAQSVTEFRSFAGLLATAIEGAAD